MLAHLSRDNNRPKLAHDAAVEALSLAGATEHVDYILNVNSPSGNNIEVL